uniref:Uncharacterized protein n=1 Tax=Arundo donax TaxID=35708 RepID=A0A0A8Y0R8_ARUDO
MRAYSPLP